MANSFDRCLISLTLNSLRNQPEEWEFDHYKAVSRKLGVEVWIANGLYGLHIKTREGYKLGDVNMVGSMFGWMTWRARVMREVRRAQRNHFMMSRGIEGRD